MVDDARRRIEVAVPVRTPGCYALLLALPTEREIAVGALGTIAFPAGWYVYVGSALAGLEQRVGRHLRPSSVRRWHIDYLRAEAAIAAVRLYPSLAGRDCALAAAVQRLAGASLPARRFGSSDCACPAHLVHFAERPRLEALPFPALPSL